MKKFDRKTVKLFKKRLPYACLGGFIGSFVYMLMAIFIAPKVNGGHSCIVLFAPKLCVTHAPCVMIHFAIGTVFFPIAYLAIGIRYIMGPSIIRGAIFAIPVYILMMVVVVMLFDDKFFSDSPEKAFLVLLEYLIFGAIMGVVTGYPEDVY